MADINEAYLYNFVQKKDNNRITRNICIKCNKTYNLTLKYNRSCNNS
jgi:hypothetical protein